MLHFRSLLASLLLRLIFGPEDGVDMCLRLIFKRCYFPEVTVFGVRPQLQVGEHQGQSQNYIATGGLPPISSSWRQAS
jgi:hypothetical protein